MRTFKVTLYLATNNGNPAKWDWQDLTGEQYVNWDVEETENTCPCCGVELDADDTRPESGLCEQCDKEERA